MSPIIKKIIPHVLAVLACLIVTSVYFYPQLQGKEIAAGDIIQYRGMSQETREYYQETGETSLWTNSMFGGMPTYQINTVSQGNNLKIIDKVGRLGIDQPIGRFFIAMIGFYVMMVVLGVNHWLAVISAIAFGFTTNNMTLFEAGHATKLIAISYFPILVTGLILAYRKKLYIWGAIVFGLGLGLDIYANHIQMTYYLFMTLLIYGIAQLIFDAQRGQLPHFLKATGFLLVGGLIALGSAASNLFVTYEYAKDTMRGEPILAAEKNIADEDTQSSSETDGLAWPYAMQWSNGTIDLFASFIPGVAGGGSQEKVRDNNPINDDINWKRAVVQPSGGYANLYWGDLPFTSGPIYFGAAVFFFFLMGLWLVKGPVKWWLGLGVLLTFLLSMGKNLEFFNRLIFDYFPLYNKFRTPNSVLSITSFLMPMLGFLALGNIINKKVDKKQVMNSLMIAGGISAAICLFFILLGPSMFDFTNPGDARYQQAGLSLEPLYEARKYHMRMDALRSLAFILAAAAMVWAYINDKIKLNLFLIGLAAVVILDLVGINRRYVNKENFETRRMQQATQPRPVDEMILEMEPGGRGFYRVMDLTASVFQSTTASMFHNSLGGYHAAKLQRYQDIIDYHLLPGLQSLSQTLNNSPNTDALNNFLATQPVINMLNAKYIILTEDSAPARNPHALGNAWFVNNIEWVSTPNEEINALKGLDADSTAVINEEFRDIVGTLSPTKGGDIQLTKYQPNALTYTSNTNGETLAVFSEIWYGPDKGWKVTIDSEPAEMIRANYLLRAVKVPAGQHIIEFKFSPASFYTGKTISQVSSLLILFGFLGFAVFSMFQYNQKLKEEEQDNQLEKPVKKTVKKARPLRKNKKGGKKK